MEEGYECILEKQKADGGGEKLRQEAGVRQEHGRQAHRPSSPKLCNKNHGERRSDDEYFPQLRKISIYPRERQTTVRKPFS